MLLTRWSERSISIPDRRGEAVIVEDSHPGNLIGNYFGMAEGQLEELGFR
jgi:hypothetical protein